MNTPGFTAEASLGRMKSRRHVARHDPDHSSGAVHLAQRKPPLEGWGGVEVIGFSECMAKCEDGHDWWELWVHAYCVGKCAIENAAGGGRIFR